MSVQNSRHRNPLKEAHLWDEKLVLSTRREIHLELSGYVCTQQT